MFQMDMCFWVGGHSSIHSMVFGSFTWARLLEKNCIPWLPNFPHFALPYSPGPYKRHREPGAWTEAEQKTSYPADCLSCPVPQQPCFLPAEYLGRLPPPSLPHFWRNGPLSLRFPSSHWKILRPSTQHSGNFKLFNFIFKILFFSSVNMMQLYYKIIFKHIIVPKRQKSSLIPPHRGNNYYCLNEFPKNLSL